MTQTPATRKTLSRKPLLMAVLLLAVVVGLGAVLHLQARYTAREASFSTTLSAASLGSRAVQLWLDERRADADAIAASPLFRATLRRLVEHRGTTDPTLQGHLEL